MSSQYIRSYEDVHTFAICAYKESAYLKECVESLKAQTVKSNIIMCTSTPCEYIKNVAKEYDVPLYVRGEGDSVNSTCATVGEVEVNRREGKSSISYDWNFALSCADTMYVTLAHQDDIYYPDYAKSVVDALERVKIPLIAFTDYHEIRDGKIIKTNKLLKIKRLMLLPLHVKAFSNSRFIRRCILSFGSAISCPTVTYCIDTLAKRPFKDTFTVNLDWEAWEEISRMIGDFVYCHTPLMAHRIHVQSETTRMIDSTGRGEEDFAMFKKFWPAWIAGLIEKFYKASEDSNKM